MGKGVILYIVMSILFMRQAGAQQAIDVHCHNILPDYMAVLEKHGACSSLRIVFAVGHPPHEGHTPRYAG
ncbi:hypothetical protein [Parabacteroides faecis]|uniref:hypothetical protein n=1 Tax=Parabacteroides faecis TaxID=1217282 RepID=UPI0021652595|nr:hypothetical protein [Parabacteroides faecis]MCS2893639.1 hypothetical protein [Parabacteroides faecis]